MLTKQKKHFLLSEAPVLGSLLYMIIPTLCTAVITELNTAIDAFFLKQVSPYASSAVTISWPIMCIMLAISYMLSLGSSIRAGHLLGERQHEEARSIVSTTVWVTLWSNIITVFLLMLKLKTVILLFGADKNTLPYTYNYLKVMLPGMIFQDLAFIAAMYLRAEGNSRVVVWVALLQTVSNIIWNIVFVVHLHFGAEGAAIASTISFFIQCIILYFYLCHPQSLLRFSFRLIHMSWPYFKTVISYGFSGLCMLILFALSQIVMNREASNLGTSYLTANTVLIFLLSIAFSVIMGITDGAEPLLAYSFGADNKQRLLQVTKWLFVISMISGGAMALALLVFPEQSSALFTGDQQGIALAKKGVYVSGIFMLFIPLVTILRSLCISIGKGLMAAAMDSMRQLLCIAAVIAFPDIWGGEGLIIAQPTGLLIGSLLLIIFVPAIVSHIKSMPKHCVVSKEPS